MRQQLVTAGLMYAPIVLYLAVVAVFGMLAPAFLSTNNFINILIQSSSIAIVAVGMTFVLLTAGIDLSVGSVMFFSGALAGTLVVKIGLPIPLALVAMAAAGLFCGLVNGVCITRMRMAPFIVTLATLFVARGAGLWVTQTRAINLPDQFRDIVTGRVVGVPAPVWTLAVVLIAAHAVLTRTAFGRHIYAVGHDAAAAQKAGIPVRRVLLGAYAICGVCAAIGGAIALAQLAAVDPNLGEGRELDAIAAAVLGGTSLFGGRGTAIGSVLGAVLIETVRNGLNIVDADPYLYPVVIGAIIFVAVLLDSVRHERISRLLRPQIRTQPQSAASSET